MMSYIGLLSMVSVAYYMPCIRKNAAQCYSSLKRIRNAVANPPKAYAQVVLRLTVLLLYHHIQFNLVKTRTQLEAITLI